MRRLIALAALALAAAPLGGCGFTPLYASPGAVAASAVSWRLMRPRC